jgi:ABC-2 type transport system permease protein
MTLSMARSTTRPQLGMTGMLRSFAKLTFTRFKLFLREPVAFFFNLAFPVLLLILFGVIWGNEPGSSMFSSRFGYIDAQVPALAIFVIGTVAFMTIPVATATDREQKLLRQIQSSPLQPVIYLAADVTLYFLIALTGMLLLVIVATFAFGLRFEGHWAAVLAGFFLSALAFIAIGYIIASVAPTSRMAQVIGQVIFFPMMFLSGAAVPLAIMPENIQNIAQYLPMTHAVKLLQSLWFGGGWGMTPVLVLLGLLIGGMVLSVRVFRWE